MARRFELGMSINYASNWSVADAVREFFQNALDEETENKDNEMFIDYKGNVLSIGNKHGKLKTSSLLLGCSDKKDKDYLIGEHGEGYKVATVVLMRNGVTVKIYNNEAKEVWTSKIVNSRRYESDIVVFDIEKSIFKKDCDLVIELDGITEDMYADIVKSNIHLRDDVVNYKESKYGKILLDEQFKGKIYVNGLFVCDKEGINFGYDFKPGNLKLDRDRGLVDTFDLKFAVAGLLSGLNDIDFITKNINNTDFRFLQSYGYSFKFSDLSNKVYEDFKEEYGEDAVPAESHKKYESLKAFGYKNVVVTEPQVVEVINAVNREYPLEDDSEANREFIAWLNKASIYMPSHLSEAITNLWNKYVK